MGSAFESLFYDGFVYGRSLDLPEGSSSEEADVLMSCGVAEQLVEEDDEVSSKLPEAQREDALMTGELFVHTSENRKMAEKYKRFHDMCYLFESPDMPAIDFKRRRLRVY